MCKGNLKKSFFLVGGIFFQMGAIGGKWGENMLVELENVFLIGGIFFTVGGKCISGI